MTLDQVITRLQNIRETAPGELNVRVLIDFGDKGQWEADITDMALNKTYRGGSEVGVPTEVIIIHEAVGT